MSSPWQAFQAGARRRAIEVDAAVTVANRADAASSAAMWVSTRWRRTRRAQPSRPTRNCGNGLSRPKSALDGSPAGAFCCGRRLAEGQSTDLRRLTFSHLQFREYLAGAYLAEWLRADPENAPCDARGALSRFGVVGLIGDQSNTAERAHPAFGWHARFRRQPTRASVRAYSRVRPSLSRALLRLRQVQICGHFDADARQAAN